ncbi:hypothetical protein N7510_002699 [Penicillium lagena]|uniref:uncharacterized protein n=1 Tax=Penicillium lagena TaxID=94218 RepID=UPI00253FC1F5|nr:uncharacterized protein N7510_002699 [Penicillium lagena]KAJ5626390.1 hypothetical protein N7510_002699 [Penicillium lagena]
MRRFGTGISGNRKPKAELSPETRSAIIYSLRKGISPTRIARDNHVSLAQFTIQNNASTPTRQSNQGPGAVGLEILMIVQGAIYFSLRVGTLGGHTQRSAQIYLVQTQECRDLQLDASYGHMDSENGSQRSEYY